MPVRKIRSEPDLEEDKILGISGSSEASKLTPVYVPLKQILLLVLVVGFLYQASIIYEETAQKSQVSQEKWEECLQAYVQSVCSPKTRK